MNSKCTRYIKSLAMASLLLSLFSVSPIQAQETEQRREARMKWWTEARFGMFIHWGLYAMPARHEWVKNRERMTDEDYQKYFELFNPDLYNPEEWARDAKNAGMKCIGYKNPNSGDQDLTNADIIIDAFSKLDLNVLLQL